MALLGTIRNRFGWVMITMILVGVGSFLFMDASGPGNSLGGSSTRIGSVDGIKITRDQLQDYQENLQGQGYLSEEIEKLAWEQLVNETILYNKVEEAGFVVNDNELGELFLSEDPLIQSPIVAREFADPNTGRANTDQIRQTLNTYKSRAALRTQFEGDQLNQALKTYDLVENLKRRVKLQRVQTKFFGALTMGFYTPNWMNEMEFSARNKSYDFEYVSIPFSAVTYDEVISDEDMEAYIKQHPRQYKKEANASLEYYLFDVIPTSEDSAVYRNELETLATEFAETNEDSFFIMRNDGVFDIAYKMEDEIDEPADIKTQLMEGEKGNVFGPYLHNGQYRVIKIYETKVMPDSVKARHILYRVNTNEDFQKGRQLLDSLQKELASNPDASFDSLAIKFSQDGSASIGGDLGYKAKDGSFVAPFENYMFYTGKKDSIRMIQTQFGLHLIQITDYKYINKNKGVRYSMVFKDIIPSEATEKRIKMKVNDFLIQNRTSETLKENALAQGILGGSASGLEVGGFEIEGVGKNTASADLIRWAHDENTQIGDVSNTILGIDNEELNFVKQFVIAALVDKQGEGLASLNDPIVRADVDRVLRNERKTAVVNEQIKGKTTIGEIAEMFSVSKEPASNVKYGNPSITNAGVEPKVVATASKLAVGALSGAINGNEGIYVISLANSQDAGSIPDVERNRREITTSLSQAISGKLFQDMKDNAEIEDNRNTL